MSRLVIVCVVVGIVRVWMYRIGLFWVLVSVTVVMVLISRVRLSWVGSSALMVVGKLGIWVSLRSVLLNR